MVKMFFTGMKRRKKEIRYVSVVTFTAVLFMTGIILFQNMMNSYVYHKNLYTYGDWVVSSVGRELEHPCLLAENFCVSGGSLVNEEGMDDLIIMGKTDEDFFSLYDELFYEGHMPENENEIAMDIASLASLGYSYEVGQTIEVHYRDEAGNVLKREYELTGVLKNFANLWRSNEMYSLPNMFVAASEFDKYAVESYTTYFYQLNPKYEEMDTSDLAQSLIINEEMQDENPLTYNVYVYENRLWGAQEVFGKITIAIMLIAALGISYLLIAYTGKRREVYYRYRCIGASKTQVRVMILAECLCSTIPQVILGTGISYGIAGIAGNVIGNKYQIGKIYEFDAGLLLRQLAVIFGVILFAAIAAQFSASEKRLAGNTAAIRPGRYRRLRRIAKRTRRPERSILRRRNALRPLQNIASAAFSFAVCGCLVFCTYKISYSIQDAVSHLERTKDMELWYEDVEEYTYEKEEKKEDGYIHVYNASYTPADLSMGIDENVLEVIRRTPGIESMKLYWTDEVHYLTWEGMEESPVMKVIKERSRFDSPLEYGTEMVFYEKEGLEEVKEELSSEAENDNINWEAVEKGEEVIICYNEFWSVLDEEGYETGEIFEIEENTIHPGDTVFITHFKEDSSTSVRVAAVYAGGTFGPKSYQVIGSKALAEKIAAAEGKELKYNNIEIMYDSDSSYEATDKQLAAVAAGNGMGYSSRAEYRRSYINQAIQDISVYGSLFLMIFVVYVTLQKSFLASRNKYWKQRFHMLKQIGMENRQYMRYSVAEEAKQFLWILPGIVLGYFFIGYSQYTFQMAYVADVGLVQEPEWVMENVVIPHLQYISPIPYVAVTLFVYVIMIVNSAVVIQKSLQEDK